MRRDDKMRKMDDASSWWMHGCRCTFGVIVLPLYIVEERKIGQITVSETMRP